MIASSTVRHRISFYLGVISIGPVITEQGRGTTEREKNVICKQD